MVVVNGHNFIWFLFILNTSIGNVITYQMQSSEIPQLHSHKPYSMHKHGHMILAGLFSVHLKNTRFKHGQISLCTGLFNRRSYQMVEAMRYAIESINVNNTFLPGIILGYDIKDTCGSVENAIRASLNYTFVRQHFNDTNTCNRRDDNKDNMEHDKEGGMDEPKFSKGPETVAIIGPDTSDLARAVADFAGLFRVPVISPAATSPLLGDRDRFKYFLRTVPSDNFQVEMILDIIEYFSWNYIILLVSDDEYGRSARMAFKKQMESSAKTVCLVIDETVNLHNRNEIVKKIKNEQKSKIIVLISNLNDAHSITDLAFRAGLRNHTWIASDAWNKDTLVTFGKELMFKGMLGVSPVTSKVVGFQHYLAERLSEKRKEGWVEEFYQHERNATCFNQNLTTCVLNDNYDMPPYQIASTVNAVYAVGHALHELLRCNATKCNRTIDEADWSSLLYHLENITFLGIENKTVLFDENGGVHGVAYKLCNFQRHDEKYIFKDVGVWKDGNSDTKKIQITDESLQWNSGNKIPISNCSKQCVLGQHRRLENDNARCCWDCVDCSGNTYTNTTERSSCQKCPDNQWANDQHTGCKIIQNIYLQYSDYWSIAILILSSIGILILLSTLIVFLCHHDTPVIRASSRGLCYLILIGIGLLFMLPLIMIGEPTSSRCKLQPYTIGIAMALNIGTLLIKTNRIARIFSKKLFKKKKIRFLSPGWQYIMIICIVVVEVIIILLWEFLFHPPYIEKQISNGERIISCTYGSQLLGLVFWSIYNAGIIIICTYQAFLVRKVPTNYNEAKFIAFTMITICTAVIVYIPVYFGTIGYYRDVVACFLYIFAGSIEYACLFTPKLYVILIRPDKNIPMQRSFRSPPQSSRKFSSAFESDGDYIPTEYDLEMLKMHRRGSRKRKQAIIQRKTSLKEKNGTAKSGKKEMLKLELNHLDLPNCSTDEYSSASSDVTQLELSSNCSNNQSTVSTLPASLRKNRRTREVRFSIATS